MQYTEEYQRENTELFEFFLENSFYKTWKAGAGHDNHLPNYNNLEFMVNHKCELACKYCYMDKHHKSYFPKGSQVASTILHNTDLVIDWLVANEYKPAIEIFAGDSVGDPTCRKIIHKLQDAALQGRTPARAIVLPTNGGWLHDAHKVKDVKELLQKSEFSGISSYLSFSVDGKYMEENRPFKSGRRGWTDESYNRMFEFLVRYPVSGVHPMVYSNNIEKAIDNFLWWQEKYDEFGLDWTRMYFLEVRNPEWTIAQTKEYAKFIKFMMKWSYEKLNRNTDQFLHFLLRKHGFNILGTPFSHTGRGMPCSIQACLTLRLGDLTYIPCHRTAYKHMETASMVVEDDKIVGLEAKNVELWFSIQSLDSEVYPYCEICSIKHMCKGGCLGAQFEATGNLFAPIPSVCRLFHAKIVALIEVLVELELYDTMMLRINREKRIAFDLIKSHIMEAV
jgi:radical SAM protein with 4Fe4S-binding SPASM domain